MTDPLITAAIYRGSWQWLVELARIIYRCELPPLWQDRDLQPAYPVELDLACYLSRDGVDIRPDVCGCLAIRNTGENPLTVRNVGDWPCFDLDPGDQMIILPGYINGVAAPDGQPWTVYLGTRLELSCEQATSFEIVGCFGKENDHATT